MTVTRDESRAERKERENLDKIKNEERLFHGTCSFDIFYTPDQGWLYFAENIIIILYPQRLPRHEWLCLAMEKYHISVLNVAIVDVVITDAGVTSSWLQLLPKQQREG